MKPYLLIYLFSFLSVTLALEEPFLSQHDTQELLLFDAPPAIPQLPRSSSFELILSDRFRVLPTLLYSLSGFERNYTIIKDPLTMK